MRHILFLLFMAFTLQAIAQYPATGNKMRLGWQTTGDGLVYRGAIGDTATLDPSGLNNAWMLLDTANGNLYAYRAKAWRLVSGGGGSVSDTLTGEVKGPLDSTYIDTVANIIFTTTTDTTVGVGELEYNDTQGSLIQGLKGGNVTNVIGQQIHQRVTNATGAPLTKGTAVFLHGSQGNRITVRKALATADSTSANTFGIVAESIANNQSGYVITEGLITNMNTNALTEGAAVYLSPTVAGELTTTKPQAPQHTVYIGVCVKQNAGSGELFVKIRNGQELDELHDVLITSPASNASLYYNAAQGVWRDTGAAVLVADTSAMLTNYINVVDTAAMLTNYINIADTATMLSSYISNADTSVFARDFQISGTTNYIPKFTGANTIGNSAIYEINKKILVNSTSSITTFNLPTIELHGNGSNPTTDQPIIAVSANNGNSAISRGYLNLNRSGGTTAGNTTLVPYDYFIGTLRWAATDGIESRSGAEISAITDSITGLSDMPTALTFATTANGAASTTERMRITSAGNVGIATSSPSRPLHVAGTTAIRIPVGNLAERGTSGAGDIRVRNDTANLEFHNGTSWQTVINNADTSVFARDVQISGTANYLPKFTGSNAVGNSGVFESGGNVGIGTASPGSYLLNLRDSIGFSGNGMYFSSTNGGTANPGGYIIGTKLGIWGTRLDIWLRDAGGSLTERAVSITGGGGAGGSIGINTITPSRPLHVAGTTAIRIPVGNFDQRGISNNGDIRVRTDTASMEYYSGAWRTVAPMARVPQSALANRFSKFDANGLLDTSAVLVQSNGRIGIGVTPTEALQVNGTARATRFILNTFGSQTLSINNYAPSGTLGSNLWIGSGGQSSSGTSGASGSLNAGIGDGALFFNTTGFYNLAFGVNALLRNTTGNLNVSIGGASSSNNLDGSGNTAIGGNSLSSNTSGSFNIAIGYTAMEKKVTGSDNVAIGREAGNLTAASTDNTASDNSIYIGSSTKTASSGRTGEIVIGHAAVGNGSNTTTIGNTSTTATYIPAGKMYIGGTTAPTATLHVNGSLSRNAPVTVTANYTVAETVSWIVCDGTATIALTLPAAASWTGREIMVKTIQPYTVTSASANVVPIDGVAATNAILPATDGAWATLVSDGTNWIIMQQK